MELFRRVSKGKPQGRDKFLNMSLAYTVLVNDERPLDHLDESMLLELVECRPDPV